MRWLQSALKQREDLGKKNVPELYKSTTDQIAAYARQVYEQQKTACKTAGEEVRKIRELNLDLKFPGEDDGHLKTPEDATTMATNGQDVATAAAAIVATNEPGHAVLAARRRAGQSALAPVSGRDTGAGPGDEDRTEEPVLAVT